MVETHPEAPAWENTMQSFELRLPDEVIALLYQSNKPLAEAARELIVLELYRRGLLSSGKAAELLGMGRWDFVRHASGLGIPFFDMTEDEWAAEVALIDQM
jgi:predicted HTH domain antitoxin